MAYATSIEFKQIWQRKAEIQLGSNGIKQQIEARGLLPDS